MAPSSSMSFNPAFTLSSALTHTSLSSGWGESAQSWLLQQQQLIKISIKLMFHCHHGKVTLCPLCLLRRKINVVIKVLPPSTALVPGLTHKHKHREVFTSSLFSSQEHLKLHLLLLGSSCLFHFLRCKGSGLTPQSSLPYIAPVWMC